MPVGGSRRRRRGIVPVVRGRGGRAFPILSTTAREEGKTDEEESPAGRKRQGDEGRTRAPTQKRTRGGREQQRRRGRGVVGVEVDVEVEVEVDGDVAPTCESPVEGGEDRLNRFARSVARMGLRSE